MREASAGAAPAATSQTEARQTRTKRISTGDEGARTGGRGMETDATGRAVQLRYETRVIIARPAAVLPRSAALPPGGGGDHR